MSANNDNEQRSLNLPRMKISNILVGLIDGSQKRNLTTSLLKSKNTLPFEYHLQGLTQ